MHSVLTEIFCHFLFQKVFLASCSPVSSSFNLFPLFFLLFGSLNAFIFFLPSLSFFASLHAHFSFLVTHLVFHFCVTLGTLSGHRTLPPAAVSLRLRQWIETRVLEEVSPTSCRYGITCTFKNHLSFTEVSEIRLKKILRVEPAISVYRTNFVPGTRKRALTKRILSDCEQPSAVRQAGGGAGVATVAPMLASRTPRSRAFIGPFFGVVGRASLTCKLVCVWDF